MDALVLLGSFAVLMILGVPVAYALGAAAIIGAWWIDIPIDAVMIQIAAGVNKFSLLAIRSSCWLAPSWPRRHVAAAGELRQRAGRLHPRRFVAGEYPGVNLLRRHLRLVGGGHRLDRIGIDPRDGKRKATRVTSRPPFRQRLRANHPHSAQSITP